MLHTFHNNADVCSQQNNQVLMLIALQIDIVDRIYIVLSIMAVYSEQSEFKVIQPPYQNVTVNSTNHRNILH